MEFLFSPVVNLVGVKPFDLQNTELRASSWFINVLTTMMPPALFIMSCLSFFLAFFVLWSVFMASFFFSWMDSLHEPLVVSYSV